MPTCLKQHGQRHACGAHGRKIVKSLNVFPYGFSSFLNCREELVDGHLGAILVELREEQSFQVNPRIDGAIRKAHKPMKGYPIKVADE